MLGGARSRKRRRKVRTSQIEVGRKWRSVKPQTESHAWAGTEWLDDKNTQIPFHCFSHIYLEQTGAKGRLFHLRLRKKSLREKERNVPTANEGSRSSARHARGGRCDFISPAARAREPAQFKLTLILNQIHHQKLMH